jgi:hypothetical protein
VAASRTAVADRLITPWWYHPALGVLLGALIAAQALPSVLVRVAALAGVAAGLSALMSAYRRLTGLWVSGLWVSGFHPGRARRWAVVLGVVVAWAFGGAALATQWGRLTWVPPAVGLLVVPVIVIVGRRYDRELRADLRAQE